MFTIGTAIGEWTRESEVLCISIVSCYEPISDILNCYNGKFFITFYPTWINRHTPGIFSKQFSSMKTVVFGLKFHLNMFPGVQLTIFQHRYRQWLGAGQATSYYLNRRWPMLPTHVCATRPQWVNGRATFNSMWTINTIWPQRSYSALGQIMVHCLFSTNITCTNADLLVMGPSEKHFKENSFQNDDPLRRSLSIPQCANTLRPSARHVVKCIDYFIALMKETRITKYVFRCAVAYMSCYFGVICWQVMSIELHPT